jgi:type IV secretion system protein VirB1
MRALIGAESQWRQFAVADAGPRHLPWIKRKALVRSYFFATQSDAVAKSKELLNKGHTVSVGLTQINDQNFVALGLDIDRAFDVCLNMAGGAKILTDYYIRAVRLFGDTPAALRAALSGYNSGSWERGERDGYVDLVYLQAGMQNVASVTAFHRTTRNKKNHLSGDQQFTLLVEEFE